MVRRNSPEMPRVPEVRSPAKLTALPKYILSGSLFAESAAMTRVPVLTVSVPASMYSPGERRLSLTGRSLSVPGILPSAFTLSPSRMREKSGTRRSGVRVSGRKPTVFSVSMNEDLREMSSVISVSLMRGPEIGILTVM